MRTIGFRSNVLFIIAAAIGLVAALGRRVVRADAGAPTPEETRSATCTARSRTFFSRLAP